MLEAVCPNGHRLQIPPEHAGMKLRCPACNVIFQLAGGPPTPGASGVGLQSPPAGSAATSPAAPPPQPAPQTLGVEPPAARWSGSEAATPPLSSSSPPPAQRSGIPSMRRVDLGSTARIWGQIGMMIGLVMVLSARGCDGLSARNVARLEANRELAANEIADREKEELFPLQRKFSDEKASATDRDDATKRIEEIRKKYAKEKDEFAEGEGRKLEIAARDARYLGAGWGYWREMAFVAGSILLSIGLIALVMYGINAERYLAFGMLAILIFSIYIGGVAWFASVVNTVQGFVPRGLR